MFIELTHSDRIQRRGHSANKPQCWRREKEVVSAVCGTLLSELIQVEKFTEGQAHIP